jgi:hypothetical protein
MYDSESETAKDGGKNWSWRNLRDMRFELLKGIRKITVFWIVTMCSLNDVHQTTRHYTEQAGLEVTICTCIREALYSNLGGNTAYPHWGFCQFLQTNSTIVRLLGLDCVLPNPFQFFEATASGRCNRLRSLVCVWHWLVKCSNGCISVQ